MVVYAGHDTKLVQNSGKLLTSVASCLRMGGEVCGGILFVNSLWMLLRKRNLSSC